MDRQGVAGTPAKPDLAGAAVAVDPGAAADGQVTFDDADARRDG
ncbi:hypothetical protein ABGB18_19565 [Nonomuraea sp. B12E4]